MSLNTKQKIWLWLGNAIAIIGFVAVSSATFHINGSFIAAAMGGLLVLLGTIFSLIGVYQYADKGVKPSTTHLTTSIMFTILGFIVSVVGVYDGNKEIVALGVLIVTLVLVGTNITAYKPGDVKAFNAINLTYTAIGLGLVGLGVADKELPNASAYSLIGAFTIALASVSSSLVVYTGV